MDKSYKVFFALTFLFGGILLGIFLSPIKKGVYCGNNNNNTFFRKTEDDWDDDDGDVIRF